MNGQGRTRAHLSLDEPLPTEDAFFNALVEGDVESLQRLLADDFVLVDVRRGAEVGRSAFLDVIAARQLEFTTLTVVERRVRRYGEVAVVVGRTAMRGDVGGEAFAAASRYTHVFARTGARDWRLVSAQGTQITE
jgi:ketosteroid isomerase-like protein